MADGKAAHEVHDAVLQHAVRLWEEEKKIADELGLRENIVLSAIAVLLGLGAFQMQWFRESDRAVESEECVAAIKLLLFAALAMFGWCCLSLVGPGFRGLTSITDKGCRSALYRFALRYGVWWDRWCGARWFRNARRSDPLAMIRRWADGYANDHVGRIRSLPPARGRSSHLMDFPQGFLNDTSVSECEAKRVLLELVYVAYGDIRSWNADRTTRLKVCQSLFLFGVFLNAVAVSIYLFVI